MKNALIAGARRRSKTIGWQLRIWDSFTGTDGANILSRIPDVRNNGAVWTSTGFSASISSNRATGTNANNKIALPDSVNGVAVECMVTASTSNGTAASVGTSTVGSEHVAIQLQVNPAATNVYFRLAIIAGQGWVIYRNNAGSAFCIAAGGDGTTYASGTVHKIRLERIGTSLRALINDVEIYNSTDATSISFTDVGIVGITATGTKYWDDFKAYSWTSAL